MFKYGTVDSIVKLCFNRIVQTILLGVNEDVFELNLNRQV